MLFKCVLVGRYDFIFSYHHDYLGEPYEEKWFGALFIFVPIFSEQTSAMWNSAFSSDLRGKYLGS